jgi:ketosteroid isomerase-like protein
MMQGHVELAHQAYDAFNRRDLDAFLKLMDPDVEAFPRVAAMQGSYHRGHRGIRRWWGDLFDVFPDFALEVVEVRDLGEMTLAVLRFRGHGADSESPFDQTLWQVARWPGGKCVWWRSYDTENEALDAVGLSE